jgi:hypothetical protein
MDGVRIVHAMRQVNRIELLPNPMSWDRSFRETNGFYQILRILGTMRTLYTRL